MVKYRRRPRITREQYNKIIRIRRRQEQIRQERDKKFKQEESKRTTQRVRELYRQYLAWLQLHKKYDPDCDCGNGGIASGW